jgi:hypothetical protein
MSGTTERPGRSRRRPAAASRILVTGLTVSATLGLLAEIDPGPAPAAVTATSLAGGAATPGRAAGRRSGRRPDPVTRTHARR